MNFNFGNMLCKGILIPIGGNEDKGIEQNESYTLDFVKDGILSRVVRESGGTDARILVIPTASSIPKQVGENYTKAFNELGCTNFEIVHIRKREDSEKQEIIQKFEKADCIMFTGGDQSKIVDKIGNTPVHAVIQRRFIEEPIVIAGTSAGAMAMSNEMIAGGKSTEALSKGAVLMREGMGFIPDLIIDSHFIQRGRFGRLAEAVARFPKLIGIGLAEDTGIIIRNLNECKVIGSGMIIVFDGSSLTHNTVELLPEGTPMTVANLKVHVLANSDSFLIKERVVKVLPIEAEFEN